MSQNETIPGGKYLSSDGETFVDAWGKPLEEETHEESQGTPLDKMKRADLEEMSVLAGMPEEEARAAKNMGALVEFIESQSAPDGNKNEEES